MRRLQDISNWIDRYMMFGQQREQYGGTTDPEGQPLIPDDVLSSNFNKSAVMGALTPYTDDGQLWYNTSHQWGGMMAAGGIVTRPTAAIIGEAGPEAVIPLSRMGGMVVNVNWTTTVVPTDEELRRFARTFIPFLKTEVERRGGSLGIN